MVAFKEQNVISTLEQLRSSYIYRVLKLFCPFEGNREADVTPGENEFDTPALRDSPHTFSEKDTEDRGAIKYPLSELVIWAVWHFFSLSKCWAVPAIFAASIHSTSICWALLHWILRTEQQI